VHDLSRRVLCDPAQTITLVERSDRTGMTLIFTTALSHFSAKWAATVGAKPQVRCVSYPSLHQYSPCAHPVLHCLHF
jgi:hypothetical protein